MTGDVTPKLYEVYEEEDTILPRVLRDADSCAIRVELHDDHVILHVGQRDWSWNRKTGVLIGSGTFTEGDGVTFADGESQ